MMVDAIAVLAKVLVLVNISIPPCLYLLIISTSEIFENYIQVRSLKVISTYCYLVK